MKAKHILLSTFLYGALSVGMLTIETPDAPLTNSVGSELFSNGTSGEFLAQAPGGERRRVRRRTRRRTRRRVERRENATNFSMHFTKTYTA